MQQQSKAYSIGDDPRWDVGFIPCCIFLYIFHLVCLCATPMSQKIKFFGNVSGTLVRSLSFV